MTYLTAFISLIVLLNGCKSSEDKSAETQNGEDSLVVHDPQAQEDTVPVIPPPEPGLAPGQVRVEGTISVIFGTVDPDSTQTLRLHIQSVLQYGPSAPPVPTGDTLDIFVIKGYEQLNEGMTVRAKLQHNVSTKDTGDAPTWSLIEMDQK